MWWWCHVHPFSGHLASRTAAHENKNWLHCISHTFLKFCADLLLSSVIVLSTVFFHSLFLHATYASSFVYFSTSRRRYSFWLTTHLARQSFCFTGSEKNVPRFVKIILVKKTLPKSNFQIDRPGPHHVVVVARHMGGRRLVLQLLSTLFHWIRYLLTYWTDFLITSFSNIFYIPNTVSRLCVTTFQYMDQASFFLNI